MLHNSFQAVWLHFRNSTMKNTRAIKIDSCQWENVGLFSTGIEAPSVQCLPYIGMGQNYNKTNVSFFLTLVWHWSILSRTSRSLSTDRYSSLSSMLLNSCCMLVNAWLWRSVRSASCSSSRSARYRSSAKAWLKNWYCSRVCSFSSSILSWSNVSDAANSDILFWSIVIRPTRGCSSKSSLIRWPFSAISMLDDSSPSLFDFNAVDGGVGANQLLLPVLWGWSTSSSSSARRKKRC